MKLRSNIYKVLISAILVAIIAVSLLFASPVKALDITYTSVTSSMNAGTEYTFHVTVTIENTELLPINSVNLKIFNTTSTSIFDLYSSLPLVTTPETSFATGGTTVNPALITTTADANWNYYYGYGYANWEGTNYYFGNSYGYGRSGTGPTSITYDVKWTPSTSWPGGNYTIRFIINASTTTFNKDTSFTLVAYSGGGGAGGVPVTTTTTIPAILEGTGTVDVSDIVDENGTFDRQAILYSEDGNATLTIDTDTVGLTAAVDGEPLGTVTVSALNMSQVPPPPTGDNVIIAPYEFGPSGATFEPPALLTLQYDPDEVPEGATLVIAYYSTSEGKWITVEDCVVDTENYTVSAPISHFTVFAIIASVPAPPPVTTPPVTTTPVTTTPVTTTPVTTPPVTTPPVTTPPVTTPKPAAFTCSTLNISPKTVKPGEQVTVSCRVTNTGEAGGSYTVSMKVNKLVEGAQEVTLAGGVSEVVTFTTSGDITGNYLVQINGLSGSFTVSGVTGVRAWVWWLVGIIVVAIIGLAVWWFWWRRRVLANNNAV